MENNQKHLCDSNRNDFKQMLSQDIRKQDERFAIDGDLLIAVSIALMKKADVYIWGNIGSISIIVRIFKSYGLNMCAIIDSDEKIVGNKVDDIDIISPHEFVNLKTRKKFVFIATRFCSGYFSTNFYNYLHAAECKDYYVLTDYDKEVMTAATCDWIDYSREDYYKNHRKELIDLYDILGDEESRETLYEYVKTYIYNLPYSKKQLCTKNKYFFVENGNTLYKHMENEVWLNCGASVGDTIFAYFSHGLKIKKIYAYEGEGIIYKKLKDNVSLLPDKIRNKIDLINNYIDESTDFSIIKEKVTLINADIEGAEMLLLRSLSDIIKKDRPVISICVYHLKEDLVVMPNYIKSLLVDCQIYLRKYTPWIKNINRNHELVLYVVPKERLIYE